MYPCVQYTVSLSAIQIQLDLTAVFVQIPGSNHSVFKAVVQIRERPEPLAQRALDVPFWWRCNAPGLWPIASYCATFSASNFASEF